MQNIPIERNDTRVIQLRKEYCDSIAEVPNEILLFLDETGINLHTSSHYGYALAGEIAYTCVPASRGRNLTLITVISTEGIVAYALVDRPMGESQ